jgi:hypothetical protein
MMKGWTKPSYIVCIYGNVTMKSTVQLLYTSKNEKYNTLDNFGKHTAIQKDKMSATI